MPLWALPRVEVRRASGRRREQRRALCGELGWSHTTTSGRRRRETSGRAGWHALCEDPRAAARWVGVKKRENFSPYSHWLCEKEKNPLDGKRSHNSVCGLAKLASELSRRAYGP